MCVCVWWGEGGGAVSCFVFLLLVRVTWSVQYNASELKEILYNELTDSQNYVILKLNIFKTLLNLSSLQPSDFDIIIT